MSATRQRVVYRDEGIEPTEDAVEFRLTYEGKLVSSRTPATPPALDARAVNKHALRKHFHPQIRSLWQARMGHDFIAQDNTLGAHIDILAKQFTNNHFRWVPLVRNTQRVNCSLDVLYLRKGPRGGVLGAADIDNRMKTLIDALTMPAIGKIDPTEKPGPDEDPFFVLLEDDCLVTRLSVEADTLLSPTDPELPADTDSRIVVTVRTWYD